MSKKFNAAKQALEQLHSLQPNQINNATVLKQLKSVNKGLRERWEISEEWFTETKLSEFPSIFLKLLYAAENARRDDNKSNNNDKDFTQEILSRSLSVLCNACVSDRFSSIFYKSNLTLHLLIILARQFCDDGWDGKRKKRLAFYDAINCMTAINNALYLEPRVGEQLRQYQARSVLEQFLTCKWTDTALCAYSICSFLVTDPKGNDLHIRDDVLLLTLQFLTEALKGEKKNYLASGLLKRLHSFILCSDNFNKQVVSCKDYDLLDLLTNILAAPEPPNAADSQLYFHDVLTDSGFNGLYTTYLEKERAASVCLALLLSEKLYHKNAYEMQKSKRLLHALNKAAKKPNEKLREVTKGVLWQLQGRLRPSNAQTAAKQQVSEPDAADRKLRKRPSAKPNKIDRPAITTEQSANDKTSTIEDNDPATAKRKKSAKRADDQHKRHQSAVSKQTVDYPLSTVASNSAPKKHTVMISYSSNYKPQLVQRINKSLQDANIDTWIYNEKLEGYMYSAMAKAIEECSVVLACFSSAYYNSNPCHAEMNYTRYLEKPLVLVRLEKFKPLGWLGISVADIKYHDFAEGELVDEDDGKSYKSRMADLIRELSKWVKPSVK